MKRLFLVSVLLAVSVCADDGDSDPDWQDGGQSFSESADETPSGSPPWFDWQSFAAGWSASWAVFVPCLVYGYMRKAADDALE